MMTEKHGTCLRCGKRSTVLDRLSRWSDVRYICTACGEEEDVILAASPGVPPIGLLHPVGGVVRWVRGAEAAYGDPEQYGV